MQQDNARKFIVDAIDSSFLEKNNSKSFLLIVDWLVTEEDSEKKIVYKKFTTGEIQYWLVEKFINGASSRVTNKTKLAESEYNEFLKSSTVHLEKMRYEFSFTQDSSNNISFELKYDEFAGSKLCMLEVDGANEEVRDSFNLKDFPYKITEVTGNMQYYGYRISTL